MWLEIQLFVTALGPPSCSSADSTRSVSSLVWLWFVAGLNGGYQDELVDHRLTEREWADEWKHLDHVRNGGRCGKCCRTWQPRASAAPVHDFPAVDAMSGLCWWLVEEQATTGRWMVGRAGRSSSAFLAGFLCPQSVETQITLDEASGAGELLLQSTATCCPGWLSSQAQPCPHAGLLCSSPGRHRTGAQMCCVQQGCGVYRINKPILIF